MNSKGETARVALVTGGATGIGKAIAVKLAKAGINIAFCFNSSYGDAQDTKKELLGFGVKAKCYKCNVGVVAEIEELVKNAVLDFGRIDFLVNAAGTTYHVKHADLEGMKEEYFDDIFNINVKGCFYVSRAVSEQIRKNNGVILNIASTSGVVPGGSCIAYAASKAAIINMTKALSKVFAPSARVVCLSPGLVETRWVNNTTWNLEKIAAETPLGRIGLPEDVANAAAAIILDMNFVTGINVVVDGGRTLC